MNNHTPGPWATQSGSVVKITAGGKVIQLAHMDRESGNGTVPVERDCNAHLMAAATDMLAALRIARHCIPSDAMVYSSGGHGDMVCAIDAIDAAITKATPT